MLTERRAELLALQHRIEKRIRGNQAIFWIGLAICNLLTEALAMAVALHLAHDIWLLRL